MMVLAAWLASAVLVSPVWSAPARVSSFRWSRAIEQPALDRPTLAAIALDSPIFAGSESGLADLRLRTADGEPVAFVLRPAPNRTGGMVQDLYPAVDFRVREDPRRKQTLVEFETRGEPLTRLTLATSQTNFSRAATLEVLRPGAGPSAWRIVSTQQLSRLAIGPLKKDELSMSFPEQRGNRFRLVVTNGDSPPVAFTGLELQGPQYQLVFLAAPGQRLTLEYGRAGVQPADYDTAAIDRALADGIWPAPVALGDPVENPAAPPSRWTLTRLFGDGRVVAAVLGTLAVLLGWMLYRASRRIDLAPPA